MAFHAECPFRVLIAGGGIAGLALSNALQRAGIDSLLLEAHDEVAPRVGASIGIFANGGRILDQLEVYDDIYNLSEPVTQLSAWRDGQKVESTDGLRLSGIRHGYPFICLERYHVIQALYKHIPDQTKVLHGKRINRVDHFDDRVVVQCKDGSSYVGDIIIGADGVHSLVRQEMWRHANLASPGFISDSQQNLMTSEYRCLWALSNPVQGTLAGQIYKIYGKDTSFLIITGMDNKAMWFVFDKMDKKYRVPEIPKFTQTDAANLVHKHLSTGLTDKVTLDDLWSNRVSYSLLPLEEALYDKWTWGRFACIGDSAHKMTPNHGQGGNNAIESAAAVANAIHEMLLCKRPSKPSTEEIEQALRSFQSHREERTKEILTLANKLTRFEALKGPAEEILAMYIAPHIGDMLYNRQSAHLAASERLNFLPEPGRALKATMPFDQGHGKNERDSLLRRSLRALPLLAFAILGTSLTSQQSLVGPITTRSVAEIIPLTLLWILESYRRANFLALTSIPLLFAVALPKYNITTVVAAYFFLHYIQSPSSKLAAKDQRMINTSAACTALLSIVVGTSTWQLLPYQPSSPAMIPLLCLVSQSLLRHCVQDTTERDRFHQTMSDLPALRFAVKTVAAVAVLAFNWQRLTQGTFIMTPLVPALVPLTWMWLLFEDLRAAKVMTTSRLTVLVAMALGTAVAGPGAVLCAMWLWREELIADRKQCVTL